MAVKEEAETARPEPKEAGKVEVKGVRIEAPGTKTTLPGTPAGSIGSMGRGRGFVRTDITALGETTRAPGRDTIEISSPELK